MLAKLRRRKPADYVGPRRTRPDAIELDKKQHEQTSRKKVVRV